jgi:hypothetical protein
VVVVATPAIAVAGALSAWQESQALTVPSGMCEFTPAGEVGGSTTILVTPANVLPVTVLPWHTSQALFVAVCTIFEFAKVAPSATGTVMLVWHTWHSCPDVYGRWLSGNALMLKLAAGMA